jgi:hypothetical protein
MDGKTCIPVKAGCSVACLEWWRRINASGLQYPGQGIVTCFETVTAKEARNWLELLRKTPRLSVTTWFNED